MTLGLGRRFLSVECYSATKKVLITSFCLGMGFVRCLDWMGFSAGNASTNLCEELRVFVHKHERMPFRGRGTDKAEVSLAQRWPAKFLVKSKGSVGALRAQYTELFEEEDCQANGFEFFVLRIASLQ